ncbi:MAG TPA: DUF5667 domain-containing protein [Candidatus Paceibacterota bacterium]|nr:DUF5667 domain-containing protein [Candidatus Paceibacterota bacterium]
MKHLSTIFEQLKRITLASETRARVRAALSEYADLHTMPERGAAPALSPLSVFFSRTRSVYAGALALVLVIAGGTQASLAAEGSLPGDLLYPLKVSLNEPVAMVLSVSSEQKAELSARFASRRVDEATALSSEGKLDDVAAAELATRFDTHVDRVAKETQTLEARGELAVSLAVRTDLSQRVMESAETLADDSASAATLTLSEEPKNNFAERVFEKSKSLAITRDRIDTALALDDENTEAVNLSALAEDDSSPVEQARLFFAAKIQATSTASSTASTTEATSSTRLFKAIFSPDASSNR